MSKNTFEQKYLKYKRKYLDISFIKKNIHGGGITKSDEINIKNAGPELKEDPAFLTAIEINPYILNLVKETHAVRNDPAIILTAIKKEFDNFKYAGPKLKEDPAFLKAAIEVDAMCLSLIDKRTEDLILTAVKKNGTVLQFVDDEFKNDHSNRHIVLLAIQNGGLLSYAGRGAQYDEEIVLKAIEKWEGNLLHLRDQDNPFLRNMGFLLKAINIFHGTFNYITDPIILGDTDFILNAIKQNSLVLSLMKDTIIKNQEYQILAIQSLKPNCEKEFLHKMKASLDNVIPATYKFHFLKEFKKKSISINDTLIKDIKNSRLGLSGSSIFENTPGIIMPAVFTITHTMTYNEIITISIRTMGGSNIDMTTFNNPDINKKTFNELATYLAVKENLPTNAYILFTYQVEPDNKDSTIIIDMYSMYDNIYAFFKDNPNT